jgi:hypothetical protein
MAAIVDKVSPGDVITSELFNRVIDLLNEHDALLAGSTISGPFKVEKALPPVLRMGEELRVYGSGLDAAGLKDISIEGKSVPLSALKAGSGSGLLIFDVPPIIGIPDAGKTVVVTVVNKANESDFASFFLLPGVSTTLDAAFTITRTLVSPGGNLAASTGYDFTFSIEAFSNRDETYILDPKIVGAPAGWTAVVKGGGSEIFIAKSQPTPTTVPVVIRVTTGAAGGGTLSLGIRSKNFVGVTGSSQGEPVAIGATPGSPNLDVEFMSPNILGLVNKFANGSIYVKSDANPTLQKAIINPLKVKLKVGGSYTVGAAIVSNGDWTVAVTGAPFVMDTTGTPNSIQPIVFTVAAKAGAADADLEIPVTGAGPVPDGSFKCKLKLRADPGNPIPL